MGYRINNVLGIIEQNSNGYLRLSPIARAVGLSPSRFRHLFKQEIGQDFRSYLLNQRLTEAQKWLAEPCLTIEQIANRIGYSHARNFVRAFKKRFGQTPSGYRKELRRQSLEKISPFGALNSLFGDLFSVDNLFSCV